MARPTAIRPLPATREPAPPAGGAVVEGTSEGTSEGSSMPEVEGKSSVMGGAVSVGVSMMMVLGVVTVALE